MGQAGADYVCSGVPPSPCFPIFLARTTFVLESLPEAKILARMLFFGILSLTVVILEIIKAKKGFIGDQNQIQ